MLSFFPRDVLNEILNLLESVSEGFPSYSFCFTGSFLASSGASVRIYCMVNNGLFRPRGYKTFFILNLVEHEISNDYQYKSIKKFVQISLECYIFRS